MTTTRAPWLTHPAVILGALALVIHAIANQHYDFFRDELYFIVCGRHPAWGYVDQPPLVPLIAGFADWAAPGSLLALRAMPALLSAATIAATVVLVRRLGGAIFAQWLAGLCVLLAPFNLTLGLLLVTDLFLPLAWIGCSLVLIDIVRTGDQRRWLIIGAIAGFALWSKYLILFNLVALAAVMPFTPLRRAFATPWPYLAALLAALIVAPNLLWQWSHGWPFLEIGAHGASGKNIAMSLPQYLLSEVVLFGPTAAIVWIAGLAALAFSARWQLYRVFALQYAVFILIEVVLHGKDYYAASLYPTLFAFGAVAIEAAVSRVALRGALVAIVVAVGMLAAPMALPLLPVDRFIAYERALGYTPAPMETRALSVLPQLYADMFGWREMARQVSRAYWALSEDERAKAVFAGGNYGETAAVDVFGDRMPPSISGHNNYFIWGPRGHDGSVMIVIGGDYRQMVSLFRSVEKVGTTDARYAMPYETGQPIYVLRGLKGPMAVLWPTLKRYR
jgi:4-amino-4-deoxy-L-arabinose transferase-like glycosyltransferase